MSNTIMNLNRDVDDFTRAYIEAAIWSSTDDDGEPLDKNYSWANLTEASLAKMVADCATFQTSHAANLVAYPNQNAGQDFWLTRNGHGAGFWENDFGTESQCEALAKASKLAGECNLYVGDDGKLHC